MLRDRDLASFFGVIPAAQSQCRFAGRFILVSVLVSVITSGHASATKTGPTASPTSINFGSVIVGQTATQSVTIANNGNYRIMIAGMSTAGPGFAAGGLTLPLVLNSGASATFQVMFSPSNAGDATGSVSLYANNNTVMAVVPMAGTGTVPIQHSATLNWVASTSTVIGYYVYRGTVSGGPYTRITSSVVPATSYSDASVQAGGVYYYVVTAVDASYIESVYSTEVQASIPSP